MKPWQRRGLVVLLYVALTLGMTWPVVTQLSSHVVGSGGDPWQTMWRFEHAQTIMREAISHGEFGSVLHREFFGGGDARLVNHSVWLWLPIHLLLGQPLAYNIIWLLSFILSGFCMYALCRHIMNQQRDFSPFAREAAATLAGLMYMFLPYHAAHALGHFGAMQMQWLPLALLAFLRWYDRPTSLRTLALVVVVSVQGMIEHHYLAWLAIALIFIALWQWRGGLSFLRRVSLPAWGIAICGMVFGIILPYLPTIRQASLPGNPLVSGSEQVIRFSADLFAYVVPAAFHSVWGANVQALFAGSFTGNVAEATHFIGYVPLLLIIFFGHKIASTQRRYWAALAILFFVISLGPRLHMFGRITAIPLPYALIDSLPVFSAIRAIARAGAMVGVATAVLFALVLASQVTRRGNFILLGGAILIEFLFLPVPLQSAQLSPVYQVLKDVPGEAVLEIPAATNYVTASRALYASGIHGKEVVGNIALERGQDPEELREAKALPGIRQLLYLRTTELNENRTEFFGQDVAESLPDAMRILGAQAIIVHTDSLTALQRDTIRNFLENRLGLASRNFGDALLYTMETQKGTSDGIIAARGDGWTHVGYDAKRQSVFGEIQRQAEVAVTNTTTKELAVELVFTIPPESHSGLRLRFDEQVLIDHPVVQSTMQRILFTLPPGAHTLQFTNQLPSTLIIQNASVSKVPTSPRL